MTTELPEDDKPRASDSEAEDRDAEALRAILAERLKGPFVRADAMRDRVESMIAGKRRD
jgi:hypothetical protein